jgi:hypothetical protein
LAIEWETHRDGVILPIRAQAGASKNAVRGEQEGRLKIAVTQAPEKGKANKAIVAQLAKVLGIKKSSIELVSGATDSRKRFLIRVASGEEFRKKLDGILKDGKD